MDYRDLNKHTIKNKFPFLLVEDILDELGGCTIFSKIDLGYGYHQLRMAIEDVHKQLLELILGTLNMLSCPFGLSNAPGTFQGLMNYVFQAPS